MVLSMLVALTSAPALLGTQEAIRQSQQKERREEHRARRCNLVATCIKSSLRAREINGRPLVLRDGKIYIDTGTSDGQPYGHHYAGYYLPYPEANYEGLVTTITDVAPIMNWVYVDKDTHELKYGVRADAQPNITGPFDCTRQDRRLTFEGWEGFCAVEEFPALWAVYFDRDDDGLKSKVAMGIRVLEIELSRKEKRWKKDVQVRTEDQTTSREKQLDKENKEIITQPTDFGNPYAKHENNGQVREVQTQPEAAAVPSTITNKPQPRPSISLSTKMSNMSLRGMQNSPSSVFSAAEGSGSMFSGVENNDKQFTPASSVNGDDIAEMAAMKGRLTPPLSTVREEFGNGTTNADMRNDQVAIPAEEKQGAPDEATPNEEKEEQREEAGTQVPTRFNSVKDAVFGAFRRGNYQKPSVEPGQ